MPGQRQRLRLPFLASILRRSRATVDCTHTNSQTRKNQQHRRVVVMGAARVGKTCIISQFLYDKFQTRYKQTIEELHRADYDLPDGSTLTLDILDTTGSYEFPAMRKLSISTAGAFILVYAIDDLESWHEVERFRNQILATRDDCVPMVIVGNKLDQESNNRQVYRENTEELVRIDWRCGFVECSAKDNDGIVEVFKELLVQANIRYNLSPAVRRRRQSLPSFQSAKGSKSPAHTTRIKRNSCTTN